ncbi:MAG: PBP1A family penicillin-binding protein [Bacteroidales bacterium]|nr:PBP1A family penicillin-binding protein [Bacteroidales bacterium]
MSCCSNRFFNCTFSLIQIGLFGRVPSVEKLKNIQNYLASEIYSTDGALLGTYYIQNRTNISINDIPVYFTDALVATEDVRFYEHKGIDRRSLFRVLIKSVLLQNESSGGGSTISQQLAKNLFPRKEYWVLSMPINKIREMIVAVRLEKAFSKKEILELYLNTVSFGENTFGIETASRRFFGKKPSELNIQESALLVGMLKATGIYNPQTHPKNALARRNVVLSQMVKYNYLEKEKADSIKELPVKLNYFRITHNEGPAPYFREHLRQEMLEWCKKNRKKDGTEYNIYTDGLKIYTTINYDLQKYAEEAVNTHMKYLQKLFDSHWSKREPWGANKSVLMDKIRESDRYKNLKKQGKSHEEIMDHMRKPVKTEIFSWEGKSIKTISPIDSIKHYLRFLQAGFLAMEAKTGYIRAWVGGINYKYFQYDHVTSKRQPGSVFKPLVYVASLEKGITPCEFFANDSVVYTDYDDWTPGNSDGKYGGLYSMKGALAHSVNTVSVKLLMQSGIETVRNLSHEMGIDSQLPDVPSLALGTGEVSLFELIKAYSVFVNKGSLVRPIYVRRIEDKYGNVLFEDKSEVMRKEVISEEHAQIMTEMLKGVVNYGTAGSLRSVYGFTSEMAGKTGTTQMNTDGWFIGYTPDLVAGVWVGGENPVIRFRSMAYGQGSHAALPIWAKFMQKVYANPLYSFSKNNSFNIPEEITAGLDCPDYREDPVETIKEIFKTQGESVIDMIKRLFKRKEKQEEGEEKKD